MRSSFRLPEHDVPQYRRENGDCHVQLAILPLRLLATLVSILVYGLLLGLSIIVPRRYRSPSYPAASRIALRRRRQPWSPLSFLIPALVFIYRQSLLRDWLRRRGHSCRFIPSCTEYAVRSVRKYGLWHGLLITCGRISRCHPGYRGDYLDFP